MSDSHDDDESLFSGHTETMANESDGSIDRGGL